MRKLSNTVATKEYAPNTLGSRFTFENFSLLGNVFTFIFFCLTIILNTKAECVLVVMTATGKRLFKNNYQNASSRIATIL